MTDNAEAPEGRESFEEHPLYQAAMKCLARGDVEDAGAKLDRLVELYPDEQELRDQTVRVQLMGALADSSPARTPHGSPAPFLRNALLILLVVTVIVVGVAGFAAAWEYYIGPPRAELQHLATVQALQGKMDVQLTAGDCSGAQAYAVALQTVEPGDPAVQATVQAIDEQCRVQEEQDRLYEEAVTAEERYRQQGDVAALSTALEKFRQLTANSPGYRDVEERIRALETAERLENSFSEAQNLVQAGDRQGAIARLEEIRRQDQGFRRSQVEQLLFQAYTEEGDQLLQQANGNVDVLRQALVFLHKAARQRPADQDLGNKISLAEDFVQGWEAYNASDWVGAVEHWEAVETTEPGYGGGVLRDPLQQAYPRAADQLIDQAYGSAGLLRQAIDYLDKAIQSGNQDLVNKRQIAAEYVAGADAVAGERWDEAIRHWGAVYQVQPGYQHGVLEDRLRQVCAASPNADLTLCPP